MKSYEIPSEIERSPEEETSAEISIEDLEEAREFIRNHFEIGDRPVVTVPKEYNDAVKTGLKARTSWMPGVALIIATFARSPYLPKNQERIILKVNNISPDQVEPRFTGPDKKFHGVVVLNGPIAPEALSLEIEH